MIDDVLATLAHRLRSMGRKPRIDLPLFGALLLLMGVGLMTLYSASDLDRGQVIAQGIRFALGLALMFTIARIPPLTLRNWTPWLYAASVILLVVVVVLGEGRGANRWLDLRVVRFQPSELLKLTMPMMIAWYLNGRPLPPGWVTLGIAGALIAIPAALIAKQPDLGTALLIAASGCFGIFLSGLAWWRIGVLLAAVAAAVPVGWHFLHDYQKNRVLTLMDPEADPLGNG